jgi:hypothetical protein
MYQSEQAADGMSVDLVHFGPTRTIPFLAIEPACRNPQLAIVSRKKRTCGDALTLMWGTEMHKSRRAVSGNTFSKVVFGLTAVLLVFAPPTARPGGAAEAIPDSRFCQGYFALCAASTCTPTGKKITVRTATGGTATFPEADCTCPVLLGPSIANLAGGNMQGSCEPPGPDTIWSTYQPRPNIPQALTN